MTTDQTERLLALLERIADALDPTPERIEDRQFAASVAALKPEFDGCNCHNTPVALHR